MDLSPQFLTLGVAWFCIFIISTVCHEAAHAFAANYLGDNTSSNQMTLDPTPHMQREPIGMIAVPIISYFLNGWMMGWASAPYNPYWANRYPHRAALMALAGPIANFALVLLAFILMRLGLYYDVFTAPETINFSQIVIAESNQIYYASALLLSLLFTLNLILGLFNLLPFPPLDGHSVITLFMSEENARKFQNLFNEPAYSMMGLFLAWTCFGMILDKAFLPVVNLLYWGIVSYN